MARRLLLRLDSRSARAAVFDRDHGVCSICGLDTERIRRIVETIRERTQWDRYSKAIELVRAWCRRAIRCTDAYSNDVARCWLNTLWEVDHTKPVAEGGSNDMSNLRTACLKCHPRETGKLQRRLHLAKGVRRRAAP